MADINQVLADSSGEIMQDAFERVIKNFIPQKRWIGHRNFFKFRTRERMNSLTPVTLSRKRQNQLEEYIASSIIVHSSDGWNNLSRSVESILNGDISSAIHFAYYAELRAVMSLLAFEGIGVFDKQHVWYDEMKNFRLFKGFTTHSLADAVIRAWTKQLKKKDVLFDLVKVKNINLKDWIKENGLSTNSKYAKCNEYLAKKLSKLTLD